MMNGSSAAALLAPQEPSSTEKLTESVQLPDANQGVESAAAGGGVPAPGAVREPALPSRRFCRAGGAL